MSRPKGHRDAAYETKRRELLRRMSVRMMRREDGSLSLRELSAAAGVAIPTLRHYFGSRHHVVDAVFEECLRLGRPGLDQQRNSEQPFAQSIRDYTEALVRVLGAERDVRLGDLFAVSLAEGLLDEKLSRSALAHVVDPTVEALEDRLRRHMERGEMIKTDPKAAALMLLSPVLLATLHQDQLGGAQSNPLDVSRIAEDVSSAFIRAYEAAPSTQERH